MAGKQVAHVTYQRGSEAARAASSLNRKAIPALSGAQPISAAVMDGLSEDPEGRTTSGGDGTWVMVSQDEDLDQTAGRSIGSSNGMQSSRYDWDLDLPEGRANRHLWLGNVLPTKVTRAGLEQVYSRYGPLESVRAFTGKTYAFINFMSTADAVAAKRDTAGTCIPGLSGNKPLIVKF